MATQPLTTVADSSPSVLAVVVPALVVAAVLIGAFAWGSLRVARRLPPRSPRGAAAGRADSWRTPDGEGPHHHGRKPAEREPGRHRR
ncbi:DUF6479 family protein [Streptomyces sp. SP17BM10]|uniref:DUF6479 family protein n=1 Tax=Streptomyces sp. SP17BM10 TaxID=3002530 RepID=UPI002E76611F|nr:DUF6479 family protein [Streptomyces sp. SP17BM10]MEE1782609.1 DUF6479 family protein [Streptomyces sp. SP17BM10]